ncbi:MULTISPECIES: DUF4435 domain-containing protein [Enterobacter cloacae complex]|uniref:DUF4435 domain-containing protein n=1 Tax=Enterobacter cloacae complex TaxID=354276 RepID=UPI00079B68E3|nr:MULTISPECIES: DUF4435 domain-containing protein [Enterobacter cloacae complex]WNJ35873.1 DUF4435 domain-containing protein [Enterobacter hormaechei subsp. hormaechei]SAE69622.1 Uncharacterised protein [Enterobacter hormaechei]
MSASRLEMMLASTKQPCVLRLKLIRDKKNGRPLFVFEGKDDYDFYFHIMNLCGFDKEFSHINGSGKDQSIALYDELTQENHDCLKETYFFVDQDYSLFCYSNKNIFTLPFYAIESPLSDRRIIKHFLTSTFILDEANEKFIDQLMSFYDKAKDSFYEGMRNISIQLYMSRVLGMGVEFPTNEDIFKSINKDGVIFKINEIDVLSERMSRLSDDEIQFYNVISELPDEQLIRGKYVYFFICEWLMKIKKYIHTRIDSAIAIDNAKATPLSKLIKVQYGHQDFSIAKLAPSCKRVTELEPFLKSI